MSEKRERKRLFCRDLENFQVEGEVWWCSRYWRAFDWAECALMGPEAGGLGGLIPDSGFKGIVVLLLFFFFFFLFSVSTADPSSRSASAPDSLWKYPASIALKFSARSGLDADQRFI